MAQLTDRAAHLLKLAERYVTQYHHEQMRSEHLLAAVAVHGGGDGAEILRGAGIDLAALRRGLTEKLRPGTASPSGGAVPQADEIGDILELAGEEATAAGRPMIGSDHLVLGMLREHRCIASKLLASMGVELGDLRTRAIRATRSGQSVEPMDAATAAAELQKSLPELSPPPAAAAPSAAASEPPLGEPAPPLVTPPASAGVTRAWLSIARAAEVASRTKRTDVTTGHLLLALLKDPHCMAVTALKDVGVNLTSLQIAIEKRLPEGER